MQTKVILDRAYAVALVAYLSAAVREREGISLEVFNSELLAKTLRTLSEAALFYDKILIEKSFSTSFEKLVYTQEHAWFSDLFETFEPDNVNLPAVERLMIADDLKRDLADKTFLALAASYYHNENQPRQDPAGAIRYINQTMQAAKALQADILPWPGRFSLFQHKFTSARQHFPDVPDQNILNTIADLDMPRFSINHLSDVLELRGKPELKALRVLVNRIHSNLRLSGIEDPTHSDVLVAYIREQKELIKKLKPTTFDRVKLLGSALIPFPFSTAIDAGSEVAKTIGLRPFRWFFLIQSDNGKHLDNEKHE